MWSAKPLTGRSLPPRTLCLTFDDGPAQSRSAPPGPQTFELAAYLAAEGIPAAFFIVGRQAELFPGAAARIRALGHTVGNHGYSHVHLNRSLVTDRKVFEEILRTEGTIARPNSGGSGGENPTYFRPPYGAWSPRLAHLLNAHPATCFRFTGPVHWDFCAHDSEFWRNGRSPDICARAYIQAIQRGAGQNGIVLFHDHTADDPAVAAQSQTFDLIRILVPRLREIGFAFAALETVPAVRAQSSAAALCTLRTVDGRYLSAGDDGELAIRSQSVGRRERLMLSSRDAHYVFLAPFGPVEWIPLVGDAVALRIGTGAYLAATSQSDLRPVAMLEPTAVFHFHFLESVPAQDAAVTPNPVGLPAA